jgi:outer membrane protein OmpA-like peptidoglycan-associated protein
MLLNKISIVFLLILLALITRSQNTIIDDRDIPIDDVIAHLEKGNIQILDDHKVTLRSVHFKTGESVLLDEDKKYLDSLSNYLMLIPTVSLHVNGYTDNIGKYQNNVRLSEKRARSVKDYLLSRGLFESQITSKGFGPQSPIADNNSAVGRVTNRRVELLFKSTEKKVGPAVDIPQSVITLNDGSQISVDFFMASHSEGGIIYKDKISDKTVKKLRASEIRSIALPSGVPYDLLKVPSSEVLKITPTIPTNYLLKNGAQVKAEISKVFSNGDSLAYKESRSDKIEKRISTKDIKAIALPEGKIREITAEETIATTYILKSGEQIKAEISRVFANGDSLAYKRYKSDQEETKISMDFIKSVVLPEGIIYDIYKEKIDIFDIDSTQPVKEQLKESTSQKIDEIMIKVTRVIRRTSPFGMLSRFPLLTKDINATLLVKSDNEILMEQKLKRIEQKSSIGISLGLETELGAIFPKFYVRSGYNYGVNSQSYFHTVFAGAGKILGKSGGSRVGVDIGATVLKNQFPTVLLSNFSFDKVDFNGEAYFVLKNSAILIMPNFSIEYVSPNYSNRTVRIGFGFSLSLPTGSRIQLYGKDANGNELRSSIPLRSTDVDFLVDGKNQKRYALSGLFGWNLTFGYLLFK